MEIDTKKIKRVLEKLEDEVSGIVSLFLIGFILLSIVYYIFTKDILITDIFK